MNQCGNLCELSCEDVISGENKTCIEICGPPACVCPMYLARYRDRCVDPRLCYALIIGKPVLHVFLHVYLFLLF